jgi:hypothetical protein
MESETWKYGVNKLVIKNNVYQAGVDIAIIEYKTGESKAVCEADSWHIYNGTNFDSLGWVKIKVSKT